MPEAEPGESDGPAMENPASPSGVARTSVARTSVARSSRGVNLTTQSMQSNRQGLRLVNPSSRVKLHSATFFLSCCSLWTAACIFCVFLLLKLNGTWNGTSWWVIFSPFWVGHALHVALITWSLCSEKERMLEQLGPPPPTSASLALHAQYTSLRAISARSHLVDNTIALLDSLAMVIVKIQFAQLLNTGQFNDVSLRVVFAPIWAVWVVSVVLVCTKYKRERVIGSQRDLLYIFLLMVAFKVDNETSISWRVVFLIPWLWLSGVLVLASIVMVSLSCAGMRGWRRMKESLMPVGFLLLLLSTGIPQFAFCVNLVDRLEGNTSITLTSILVPAAVGWGAMWLSAAVLAAGLRTRERMRAQLLASGAVWAAQEQLIRRLNPHLEREQEQIRVDAMSEEELVALAQQKMQAKGTSLPTTLVRVGPALYRLPDATNHYPTTAATTDTPAAELGVSDATHHYPSSHETAQPQAAAAESSSAGDVSEMITITVQAAEVAGGKVVDSAQADAAGGAATLQHVTLELQPVNAASDGHQCAADATQGTSASEAAQGLYDWSSGQGSLHASSCRTPANTQAQGPPQLRTCSCVVTGSSSNAGAHGDADCPAGNLQGHQAHQPSVATISTPEPPQLASSSMSAARRLERGRVPSSGSIAAAPVAAPSPAIAEERTSGGRLMQQLPRLLNAGDTGLAALLGLDTSATHDLMATPQQHAVADDGDDGSCLICFDATATCVLLPCGHGGLCRRCAHLLICRPPHVCATCRQGIDQVVELEGNVPVGKAAKVKA